MINHWEFDNEASDELNQFQNESLEKIMNLLADSPKRQKNDFTHYMTIHEDEGKNEERFPSYEIQPPSINRQIQQQPHEETNRQEIEISESKIQNYSSEKKGKIGETLNLSKYVHQETFIYLKKKKTCRCLQSDEEKKLQEYGLIHPSLQNQSIFFSVHPEIGEKCQELYTSAEFIKNVLKSEKMQVGRKMMIIKHLRQIQQLGRINKRVKTWRNV